MKFYKMILFVVVIAGITLFSACDPHKPGTQKQFLDRLSYEWSIESVKVGGKDVTRSFNGLRLSLNADYSYSVTSPVSPIWAASGRFILAEDPNGDFNIVRDDEVRIIITELTQTTLKYKFPYTSAGGRTNGISGDYEFAMIR